MTSNPYQPPQEDSPAERPPTVHPSILRITLLLLAVGVFLPAMRIVPFQFGRPLNDEDVKKVLEELGQSQAPEPSKTANKALEEVSAEEPDTTAPQRDPTDTRRGPQKTGEPKMSIETGAPMESP